MKKIILLLFLTAAPLISYQAFSQTYTTESKSCGSCNKEVSKNSKIGMRCPHCGVRWGYENEQRTTSYNYNNVYDDYRDSGFTNSRVNMRSKPTTKSSVKAVIPQYTSVSILSRTGNWYYVEYQHYNGYSFETIRGYVYKTLI